MLRACANELGNELSAVQAEDKSTSKMDLPDTYHRRPPLAIMGPSKGEESSDGSVPELVYSTDGDSDDQGAGQAGPFKW